MASSPFKADILKNKVAIITGGATGIGFGIATVLGSHGAKIGIISRRPEVIDSAVSNLSKLGIEAFGVPGDVRNPEVINNSIQKIVQKFGRLDILVNNAAGNFVCEAEELSPNGFKTVQEIDLQGTFNTCLAALPHLKRKTDEPRTLIINITATLQYKACPFQVHAASAKAGIDVITQTLGIEWIQHRIRVVGIAPGPINGTEGGPKGRVFGETAADPIICGEVEDIGFTALFLATDAASFITATTVVVDGGHWHGALEGFQKMKSLVSKKKEQEKQSRNKASL